MSDSQQAIPERLSVVLVRARNPNNIGAAARAMHDFGFRDLRLVNDYAVPFQTARSAVDAGEVLRDAREFETVASAVADRTLVIGTTAVGERVLEHPLLLLAQAGERIQQELSRGAGVALLFGSEKTGLSNEELSHCDLLLTIPMHPHADRRHPSMNLGQAVAVCLYELIRTRPGPGSGDAPSPPSHVDEQEAGAGQRERLAGLLLEVLEEAEYRRHHPAHADAAQIRRMVVRLGLSPADRMVWLGMLRQILWKLRGGTRPGA